MNREEIYYMIKDNPALKILRAQHAPLILGFLWEIFKKEQKLTVLSEDLVFSLAAYLELAEHPIDAGSSGYPETARRLIDNWCREDNRYLRKYVNDRGQVVHELTGYLEKVFRWLEDLKPRETVGTESRFYDIVRRLEELVSRSVEDPAEKIRELKNKRDEIDQEIREIEASGEVQVLSSWQIRERFEEVSRHARDLLADFKEVEDNFKQIMDRIYQAESRTDHSRGSILGLTLDAHQELKASPQGKTFHSFWSFLVADAGKDSINQLVERIYGILEEKSLNRTDEFLRNLKRYLHRAGKRIIDTNHRLAEKINRLLSENSILQHRRIRELIGEIKPLVFKLKEGDSEDPPGMMVDDVISINLPMERPLRFPEETQRYEDVETGEEILSPEAMSGLFNQFYVDKQKLKANVRRLLKLKPEVSLGEVLLAYPPEQGLSEILVYYEIASSSLRSRILEESIIKLSYTFNGRAKKLKAPEVIFTR